MEKPTFVNRLTGDTELTIQGLKYLDGELSATGFEFTLTDVTDPDAPRLIQTVENTGSGLIQFDTIHDFPTDAVYQLTDPDTGAVTGYRYVYEVRESSKGADNMIVDDTIYTVTVHVAAEDGVMKVQSVTYEANGEKVDGISFYNETVPDKPDPIPDPEPEPPTPPEPVPEEPETEIPDTDVPLTSVPEEPEEPTEEIEEPDVPLVDVPTEEVPTEEIPTEEVPTEEIPTEDVPLADVPKTGDNSGLWLALTAASGTGLAALAIAGRKRKSELD